MSNVPQAAPKPQASTEYHGQVVGVVAQTWKEPSQYRVQIEACDATLYVTMAAAPPLWANYDFTLTAAPESAE